MIYELQNVAKRFGNRLALNLDHLQVKGGDIYAILGPNGAGKTTLLRILALLDAPSSGTVFFDSQQVCFRERKLRPVRRNVVLVNQRPILFSTTVYQNLAFGLKIRKIPRNQQRKIIARSLEMVGLEHLSAAPAASLSGGETQRVAIARALALEPRVILCDEPVANVDLENQSVVVGLLREINREKKITIVFSTHDRLLASSLADQTLYLDRGRLTSSPYDNLFRATLMPRGNGLIGCRIGDSVEIEIPGNRSGSARLHVDPAQVCLSRTPSGPHAVLGKIARLAEDGDSVRVRVESQLTIRVVISLATYRKNRFMVGEDVFFSIPPAAVEFL